MFGAGAKFQGSKVSGLIRVEPVLRLVWYAHFRAGRGLIASVRRRIAPGRMQSLDEPHMPEDAASPCRLRPQQQPGDGLRIRAIGVGTDLPGHLPPTPRLPRATVIMLYQIVFPRGQ